MTAISPISPSSSEYQIITISDDDESMTDYASNKSPSSNLPLSPSINSPMDLATDYPVGRKDSEDSTQSPIKRLNDSNLEPPELSPSTSSPAPSSNPNITKLERKRASFVHASKSRAFSVSGPQVDLGLVDVLSHDLPVLLTGFKSIQSRKELTPKLPIRHKQLLKFLTKFLVKTYAGCNPQFNYEAECNPRRVLTKPSKPAHNDGHDNEEWDYILYVNDILGSQEGQM